MKTARINRMVIGVVALLAFGFGWLAQPADARTLEKGQPSVQIGDFEGMKVFMGMQTVGRFQALDHEKVYVDGAEQATIPVGFQTAWGSIDFLAKYKDQIEVYFEVYLSSRPHPEKVYGHQGYILARGTPENLHAGPIASLFKAIDVKAGHFEIDYGDHRFRRSDNARVQQNVLIGNYIIDPKTVEIGVEVSTEPNRFNAMVGVGNGGTTEKFKNGTGFSLHGKVWGDVTESLRASGSFYRVDHSENAPKFAGSWSNLFSGHRSGGPYSAVMVGGNAPGQITPGEGQKVTAAQGDLTWKVGGLEVYGHVGWMEDADLNGSAAGTPQESWYYYSGESIYQFTPNLHAAVRYSGASAKTLNDVSSDGRIDRIQVGGGFWLTKHIQLKAEYVHQWCNDFIEAEGKVGGMDAWMDPTFNGVISEVSFSF